ncbi:MAG: NUDIX hydrolase [Halanaerobiales bacterium]
MLKFNFCLIKQGSKILLLNREYPAWMGCWNGVGGKLKMGETPRESVIREIKEETRLTDVSLQFKGLVTWNVDGKKFGGMYTYLVELNEEYKYPTPVKTEEGILDWKEIDWILHPENRGVARNVPRFLKKVLNDCSCYDHHFLFQDSEMIDYQYILIEPNIEEDKEFREEYLSKYKLAK